MPTGYTAGVVDGTINSFETFALQCARAFGALISMRDDPLNAEIPDEFKPDSYYQDEIKEIQDEIQKLHTMTPEEIKAACDKDLEERHNHKQESYDKAKLENDRLDKMEAAVKAWIAPSTDHAGMKDFMLDQLEISRHDLKYYNITIEYELPSQWMKRKTESLVKSLLYYQQEYEKEKQRCEDRTRWVKQLKESLKP